MTLKPFCLSIVPLAALLLSACGAPTVVRYDYAPPLGFSQSASDEEPTFEDKQPRKLAVFLDGTANNYKSRTNVRRLFEMVANQERPDIVIYYQEGVGGMVQRITSSFASLGSLLGTGTGTDIRQAFQFLAENYRAGGENGRAPDASDEVYIFGFSRGAYTARALAGLLDLYGGVPDLTPCRPCAGANKQKKYCRAGTRLICNKDAPGADREPYQRRRTVLGYYRAHQAQVRDCGPKADKTEACKKATQRVDERKAKARRLKIHTMSLWDTVRSLGVEALYCGLFKGKDPNEFGHPYHRDKLYGNVERAYHALALDERRDCYYSLLWPKAKDNNKTAVHKEVWFAGDHSNIGGGHSEDKNLSGVSFNWMIGHLSASDLLPMGLSSYMHEDHMGEVFDLQSKGIFKALGKRKRDKAFERRSESGKPKLHISVVQRLLHSRQCLGGHEPYKPTPIMSYLNGATPNEATLREKFDIIGDLPEGCQVTSCNCSNPSN